MRAKHGPHKANVATAHKLARILYFMLKHKTPFQHLGADPYEQQQRQRQFRNLHQQAARLGFSLEPAA
ncbi:MAG: hypothetical protein R3C14_16610 [Caldilineaceae bacterium]